MSSSRYTLFDTPIGVCGVAWHTRGNGKSKVTVTAFQLPEKSSRFAEERLAGISGGRPAKSLPAAVRALIESVHHHTSGIPQDFRKVSLALEDVPPFAQSVYTLARTIPPGETMTYGELATALDQPGAARAVGQALGKNPIPLLVPCHRVLAAGGKGGGFSAHGGLSTKTRLLELEGVTLGAPPVLETSADLRRATKALRAQDPVLAAIMTKPLRFSRKTEKSPYQTLLEAVASQQLSPKAASTILDRVCGLYLLSEFPTPEDLLATPDELLRGAGLSTAKTKAWKDLAAKTLDGTVPAYRELKKMSDREIIKRLTPIYGVGRWTIEMMLIFNLGRQDVLAVDDYALRRAAMLAYDLPEIPTPKEFFLMGNAWRPYRSVASLYLWNHLDEND